MSEFFNGFFVGGVTGAVIGFVFCAYVAASMVRRDCPTCAALYKGKR
jgi:hypothetical protein